MPSWMKFAGMWGLAATAALTLSWVAVSQVRDRVIQPVTVIPTTLVAIGSETSAPTVVPVEPDVGEQPEPSITTSTVVDPAPSSVESSTTSTTRAPSASSATTSITAPQTTTTSPPSMTAPSTNLGPSSHSTPGGTVTIESAPGEVRFVSAIPQAGFTTELRETGPEKVRVRFVGPTTTFEFEAEWEDGDLEISTEEHSS